MSGQDSSIIIDVREPEEFAAGHVQDAYNVPLTQFASRKLPKFFQQISKDTPLILYCRSGQRSNQAFEVLKRNGFLQVINGINQSTIERLLQN